MLVHVIRWQVLLVFDAVDALIESSESLANFIGELFKATSYLKLLITSDKGLKGLNDSCLSYHEEVGNGTMYEEK